MDSSSDSSFAWTDASEDTTDNDTMAKTNINTSQSGEESESGKTFKKKLQQRLFSGGTDNGAHVSEAHPPRKRKMSLKHSDDEHVDNLKKRQIKAEPESDVDTSKVKKKHKSSETNRQDLANGSYDENYLDFKVKNEQNFVIPSPVKLKKGKNKNVSSMAHSMTNNGDNNNSSYTLHLDDHCDDRSISLEDDNKFDFSKIKKKKKSKRKRDDSEGEENVKDSSIRDSVCTDESVIEQSIASNQNDNFLNEPSHNTANNVQNKTQTIKKISNDVEKMTNGIIIGKSPISDHRISDNNATHKSRISERIQFEAEDDSDVQSLNTKIPVKKCSFKSKVKNFLKSSYNLTPFFDKLPNALVLTDDDDMWVIRCPKDIKIEAFQDKKWTLDSKCKIKLEGQTYEGDVDDRQTGMTIVSAENEKTVIKNLTINGCVRLRRRIPKAHIDESNVMISTQNNFIPLPETKCRHPLFGVHYKKAIKIPSAVAERLRAPDYSASPDKRKKDPRKSGSNKEVFSTTQKIELATKPPTVLEQTMTTSKKKKRKHSKTADEPEAPRRQKRIKHDPESAEAWESERAIEENLFNF